MGDGKELKRYSVGDVFGESCLEPTSDDAVRKANIVAVGNAVVLKLTANAFKEQLGDLTEIVAYNFKRKVMEGVIIEGTKIFEQLGKAASLTPDPPKATELDTFRGPWSNPCGVPARPRACC